MIMLFFVIAAALVLTSRGFWKLAIPAALFLWALYQLNLLDWFEQLSFTTMMVGALAIGLGIGALKFWAEVAQKQQQEEKQRQQFRDDIELVAKKLRNNGS
jgi:hypothetical protein